MDAMSHAQTASVYASYAYDPDEAIGEIYRSLGLYGPACDMFRKAITKLETRRSEAILVGRDSIEYKTPVNVLQQKLSQLEQSHRTECRKGK